MHDVFDSEEYCRNNWPDFIWELSHPACRKTWITLHRLNLLEESYRASASIRLQALLDRQEGLSRYTEACRLAVMFDSMLANTYNVVPREGVCRCEAINSVASLWLDGESTVADLATAGENLYRHWE